MPRAEAGSTKQLNNKLKSKGLQRLRWYCQVCEKQCRDENGFKCHSQSESHVRQMLVVGENSQKYISDYSGQFQRDFLLLLRTSHGEKKINMNHFYNEYIANKEHVHMNATRWPSLTLFAKYLGKEGICRVEEGEKGLEVAWIDNSPDALRRQDAIRKKERQDKGDEEREQRLIREQVERARRDAAEKGEAEATDEAKTLQREDGEKIKLSFGGKVALPTTATTSIPESFDGGKSSEESKLPEPPTETSAPSPSIPTGQEKVSVKMGFSSKPKNVFAAATKKNAFGASSLAAKAMPQKPKSEAERIMKEEIERKKRGSSGFAGTAFKRQKI